MDFIFPVTWNERAKDFLSRAGGGANGSTPVPRQLYTGTFRMSTGGESIDRAGNRYAPDVLELARIYRSRINLRV